MSNQNPDNETKNLTKTTKNTNTNHDITQKNLKRQHEKQIYEQRLTHAKDKASLQDKIKELEEKLKIKDEKNDNLSKENEDLKGWNSDLYGKITHLKQNIKGLEKKLSLSDWHNLYNECSNLKIEKAKLERELNACQKPPRSLLAPSEPTVTKKWHELKLGLAERKIHELKDELKRDRSHDSFMENHHLKVELSRKTNAISALKIKLNKLKAEKEREDLVARRGLEDYFVEEIFAEENFEEKWHDEKMRADLWRERAFKEKDLKKTFKEERDTHEERSNWHLNRVRELKSRIDEINTNHATKITHASTTNIDQKFKDPIFDAKIKKGQLTNTINKKRNAPVKDIDFTRDYEVAYAPVLDFFTNKVQRRVFRQPARLVRVFKRDAADFEVYFEEGELASRKEDLDNCLGFEIMLPRYLTGAIIGAPDNFQQKNNITLLRQLKHVKLLHITNHDNRLIAVTENATDATKLLKLLIRIIKRFGPNANKDLKCREEVRKMMLEKYKTWIEDWESEDEW